ncbi:MAG: biopolymer transporter ExbD [Bacteroides sp.]|nr:biopolymer transporter ExbD [Bacteroides sp.]MCM1379422.1 biopolymer transporter ExbD [Bacteroides sp.]MCM1445282.1 biopolymer transporter ExbD [Prevotella sp.]
MALKRQFDMSATFSMASMTDVIFLLLIFFMVTSTFVFPNALEVNLPESATQTTLKPSARIYLDAEGRTATMYGEGADWQLLDSVAPQEQLKTFFAIVRQQEGEENPSAFVALYADREVPYGSVVEMLNLGAENDVRIVLATSAPQKSNGE